MAKPKRFDPNRGVDLTKPRPKPIADVVIAAVLPETEITFRHAMRISQRIIKKAGLMVDEITTPKDLRDLSGAVRETVIGLQIAQMARDKEVAKLDMLSQDELNLLSAGAGEEEQ